jgi:NADPH:quinone reductase-like Zn-dependent oxidoreductase
MTGWALPPSQRRTTVKVIECTRYGTPDVLQWAERPMPRPGSHELLVRVVATTVNSGDWRVRALHLPPGFGPLGRLALGLRRPRQPVLGTEFAGVVEDTGVLACRFRPGDRVFGFTGSRMGCHAEYLCMDEHGPVAATPPQLGCEQAAAMCFGGSTMLHYYRRASLSAGEHVLVIGASGTVGSAAVQLARSQGARVTAVCNTARAPLMHRLGAQHTIDPARHDFTAQGERYDVVVDCVGTFSPEETLGVLTPGGRLLLLAAGLPDLLRAPLLGRTRGLRVMAGPAQESAADVATLAALAARGAFIPVIDSVYPWADFRLAHARVESRRKVGTVVLRVAAPTTAPPSPPLA